LATTSIQVANPVFSKIELNKLRFAGLTIVLIDKTSIPSICLKSFLVVFKSKNQRW